MSAGRRASLPGWTLPGAAVLVAFVAVALLLARRPPGAGPLVKEELRGWTLVSGSLGGASGEPGAGARLAPGRYRALADTRLTRAALSLLLPQGASVEVVEGDDFPRIVVGSAELLITGGLGGWLLEGEAVIATDAARARLDAGGLQVLDGALRWRGQTFFGGQRLSIGEEASSSSAEGSESASPGAQAPLELVARVVDAATGLGIAGAAARITRFHAGGDTAPRAAKEDSTAQDEPTRLASQSSQGLFLAAAYPPLRIELVPSDEQGAVRIPRWSPGDPRIALHVQVDAQGYAPGVAIVSRDHDAWGQWEDVDISLRRAPIATVSLVGPDLLPVAGAPLIVESWRDCHDASNPRGARVDASRRILVPGDPQLLFTDSDGLLRLPWTSHPHTLRNLHPRLFFYDPREGFARDVVDVEPLTAGGLILAMVAPRPEPLTIVDAEGLPVAEEVLEAQLDGMEPRWVRTDPLGRIELALLPREGRRPVTGAGAYRGRLLSWSPFHFRLAGDLALPSPTRRVALAGAAASTWALRLLEAAGDQRSPLRPDGLAVDWGSSLVQATEAGLVELAGPPPPSGETVRLHVRAHEPLDFIVPSHGQSPRTLDLGAAVFSRGLERDLIIEVAGCPVDAVEGLFERATILLERGDAPMRAHRYPLSSRGRARLGGLVPCTYRLWIEGDAIPLLCTDLTIEDAAEPGPLVVTIPWAENEAQVAGRIANLPLGEPLGWSVVEAWWVAGEARPIVFPPYPIAPDGQFGSRRRLSGVLGVDVGVVGPGGLGGHFRSRVLPGQAPRLFLGDVRARPVRRARVAFEAPPLGRVRPPLSARLTSALGNEVFARLALEAEALVVEGLLDGDYELRWTGPEGEEEVVLIQAPLGGAGVVEVVATRKPLEVETIEVHVTGSEGEPVDDVVAEPPGDPFVGSAPRPGVVSVLVRPRTGGELSFRAPGLLAARWTYPPHGEVPGEVRLERGVSLQALLVDGYGTPVEGPVAIAWEPGSVPGLEHGEPFVVDVARGRLSVSGLPPGTRRFELRLTGSEKAVRAEWTLPASTRAVDLGTVVLQETRKLEGVVLLPGGAAASGALVTLVPPEAARDLPLRSEPAPPRYATRAGPDGAFAFDGVPVQLDLRLVLRATLGGWLAAIEDPLEEAPAHLLVLRPPTSLQIEAGYRTRTAFADYGFWLEYQSAPQPTARRLFLGELPTDGSPSWTFESVEPGLYRLLWGLRDALEPFQPRSRELWLEEGHAGLLTLEVEGRQLQGDAAFNGRPLDDGWIILSEEPDGRDARVGRVRQGRFLVLDPPSAAAYAALLPRTTPPPRQNIRRGEAIPIAVPAYRRGLKDGWVTVDYAGYNLVVEIAAGFLTQHPGAVFVFEHREWGRAGFRKFDEAEPIEAEVTRWSLLPREPFKLQVRSARGDLLTSRIVDLTADVRLRIP